MKKAIITIIFLMIFGQVLAQEENAEQAMIAAQTVNQLSHIITLDEELIGDLHQENGFLAYYDGSAVILVDLFAKEETVLAEVKYLIDMMFISDTTLALLAGDLGEGEIILWDIETGSELTRSTVENANYFYRESFTPDGRFTIFTDFDDNDIVRDLYTQENVLTTHGLAYFENDGLWLVDADGDRETITIYDVTTWKQLGQINFAFYHYPNYLPEPGWIYAIDYDNQVVFWDTTTWAEVARFQYEQEYDGWPNIDSIVFSSDYQTMLMIDDTDAGNITVWDFATRQRIGEGTNSWQTDFGQLLYIGTDGKTVVFDQDPLPESLGDRHVVTLDPPGERVVTIDADQIVEVWDIATGERVVSVDPYLPHSIDGATGAMYLVNDLLLTWEGQFLSIWAVSDLPELGISAGNRIRIIETDTIYSAFTLEGESILVIWTPTTTEFWGLELGAPILVDAEEGSATEPVTSLTVAQSVSSGVMGEVEETISTDSCAIPSGGNVLAVAQAEGQIFVYSTVCEGLVAIGASATVAWAKTLDDLPVVTVADVADGTVPSPIYTLPGAEQVCEEATTWGNAPTNPPYKFFIPSGGFNRNTRISIYDMLADAVKATSTYGVDALVCVRTESTDLYGCNYTDGSTRYPARMDYNVKLVNYETGQIFREETVYGATISQCPQTTAGPFFGDRPSTEVLLETIQTMIAPYTGSTGSNLTIITAEMINARAEPNTTAEILTRMPHGTHVNLIARNSAGDWVVALTPEMEKVWLYTSLLQVADSTDVMALAVHNGSAQDSTIPLP